jgi:hypothetical protein
MASHSPSWENIILSVEGISKLFEAKKFGKFAEKERLDKVVAHMSSV